jgi:tetratricopeptide (TPR) repeat protein
MTARENIELKKIMKKIVFCFMALIVIFIVFPATVLFATSAQPLTHFSMAFFYLYNNDMEMAKTQLELCLLSEKDPPPLIYSLLAEISDMLGNTEEADRYATKALALNPDDEISLQIKEMLVMQDHKYVEAKEFLERLLKLDDDNLQLLFYLAEVYNELGDENDLIDVYTKITQINPGLLDVHLNLGYLYTRKGLFSLAKDEYNKVLEIDPENERAFFYLAYIFLSEGKATQALTYFEKLDKQNLLNDEMLQDYAANLFIEGQNPTPILERIEDKKNISEATKGILYFEGGKYNKAQKHFEQAVNEESEGLAAVIGLIRIAEKNRNPDMEKKWRFVLAGNFYERRAFKKSLDEALKVRTLDSSFLENRYLLGDVYNSLGKKKEAVAEYEYFQSHAEDKGDVYIKLGFLYDELGNHENAVQNFLLAIDIFPDNDQLYYYLGIEYRILKDYRNAVIAFKSAIKLKQDNAYYYFNLGVVLERLGNIEEAIYHLDKSLLIDKTNAVALNYLGYLLADKGVRLEEARSYIKDALLIDPENGAYLDSMGWVYYRLDEFKKAKEYLEKAVIHMDVTDEENYLIYDHLGDVYLELGLLQKAIDAWTKALDLKFVEGIRLKIDTLQTGSGP